ncbi:hypothetical protein COCCADRAFT_113201 [Bipolaris zeicola 26-R-13]|uniref:Uncharacterized protein n=1 Tax=Cochliobolus carbonum (strain 26-R-13) TaxID=930089 RepID=W6XVQ3_COCC2|nr:uncharacterized protein COCCADRAFT_113201 [Bipolaris zeicola 26-R-13]EUC26854.1 hypothetical protein COCCADRAFT_113201 [Bipolaris zeicola 26-R-13]
MNLNDELDKPLMGRSCDSEQPESSTLLEHRTLGLHKKIQARTRWSLYLHITTLIITILTWISLFIWNQHERSISPFALIERGHCGWSVEEAKANDCVYDIMMSSWMPRPCYDEELSESFLRANNFTYWTLNQGGEEVPEAEVKKGEFDILFTHGTYHYQHCIYLWKLQMKAQKSAVRVLDSISRSQAHIAHCQKLLTPDLSSHTLYQLQSKTGTPIHVKPKRQTCWEG